MGAYDSSKRIFYYDVLRALAIILIITSHICREFAKEWPVHSLKFIASAGWMDIAVLGVPIFLMLSGAYCLIENIRYLIFLKEDTHEF